MKLSTKGRYGLKAMHQLAMLADENSPMPVKFVAEKIGVSELYLEQIFSVLKKHGLIKSVRGAQGGYFLAKHPDEITVGNVLRSLEGSFAPSNCVLEDSDSACLNAEDCVTKVVWEKMKTSIDQCVDSITLQDMLDKNI
ncbi:RrF2 family transcriptional regulator [Proteocatella sphenisci]|uniref:RrF2 family transcriptional regulator n=1 Tax=Proteocatella sphenisci TaxID=181070 RepID=UPI00048E2B57|nr:Rrf2 family transcriptional regulator [Proteocatella sphenisci]